MPMPISGVFGGGILLTGPGSLTIGGMDIRLDRARVGLVDRLS